MQLTGLKAEMAVRPIASTMAPFVGVEIKVRSSSPEFWRKSTNHRLAPAKRMTAVFSPFSAAEDKPGRGWDKSGLSYHDGGFWFPSISRDSGSRTDNSLPVASEGRNRKKLPFDP